MRGAKPERALEEAAAAACALAPGETVLVAASGGADSTALAALAAAAAEAVGATVVLGHVNHAQRPSSWQDEGVVLAVGTALRVRVLAASLPPGGAAESRLRDERYAALARQARTCSATRVFTAHHARDQTETVLLALFRGTGCEGLAGIPRRRELAPEVHVERPLLEIEPAALRAYCTYRHLPYAIDPTNDDATYRRNAVRAALAELRSSFPHLDAAVARHARLVRDRDDGTSRARLREGLHEELRTAGVARDVTFERLDAAARAIEEGRRGRHFLRHGVELIVE